MLLWSSELSAAPWTQNETSVILPPQDVFLHHVVVQCGSACRLTLSLSTSPQPPGEKKTTAQLMSDVCVTTTFFLCVCV